MKGTDFIIRSSFWSKRPTTLSICAYFFLYARGQSIKALEASIMKALSPTINAVIMVILSIMHTLSVFLGSFHETMLSIWSLTIRDALNNHRTMS